MPNPALSGEYHAQEFEPVNLGPGSITWQRAGELRNMFAGLTGGLLQLMHPAVGGGVREHSRFFDDPYERIFKSIGPILGVIYDDDPHATGRWIRDQHTGINGTDEKGRKYRALDPETFWFTHASFTMMVRDSIDRFSNEPLTPQQWDWLASRESPTWYSRYEVSMRPVPLERQAFEEKWDDICNNALELTPAAERTIERFDEGDMGRPSFIPEAIWKAVHLPVSEVAKVAAIGGLPESLRDRLGIPFSAKDQRRLDRIEAAARNIPPLLPARLRYFPRALEGMRREAAGAAARG